jgi:hypothetical protein
MSQLIILDPRAEIGTPITPYALKGDVGKAGLRVALVSNGFYDATKLLRALEAVLPTHLEAPRIRLFERNNASVPGTPEQIAEIVRESDLAVCALGQCGSCTSSATRDAVALARAGVPALALISEKFGLAAQFVARSVGMPEVPRLKLPHPVAGSGMDRIAAIADAAAADVVAAWRGDYVL